MQAEWRRLEESADATIFQSWDWCDCWLSHYGQGRTPIVIRAEAVGRTLALAPLVRQRSWFGVPLRRVSFIGTGPSDYGGFLAPTDDHDSERLLASGLADIEFDLLDLHQLPESTALRLRDALPDRLNAALIEQEPAFAVDLPLDFNQYLSSLSKKFRTNTVYAKRRLDRDHKYEEKQYPDENAAAEGMDIFFRLHQQRWLAKRLPGLFLGGRNRRFHQSLAVRLAAADRLLLSVAFIDDRPAAAFYGFKYRHSYSYYLGGFDPTLAKFSPSSVLIFNLMEKAISEGVGTFDFLRGQEAYKLKWGAKQKPLYRLAAWPSTIRGRLGGRLALRHNYLVQRARQRMHK